MQTVEEIEGVLGRDLYPNLAEERSRWEKELAGLREENESLTAMLCSKEEELNRTKATMNAIREERDRLRRRVRLPALEIYGNRPDGIQEAASRLCPNLQLPFLKGLCSCLICYFHALLSRCFFFQLPSSPSRTAEF